MKLIPTIHVSRVALPMLAMIIAFPLFAAPPKYRLSQTVIETDTDNDGNIDQTTTVTNTYSPKGELTMAYIVNTGANPQIQRTTNTYDNKGRLLSTQIEVDSEPNGTFEFSSLSVHTYNAAGDRITHVYDDSEPQADAVSYQTTTYNGEGNILSVDSVNTRTYTLDRDGVVIKTETLNQRNIFVEGIMTVQESFILAVPTYDNRGLAIGVATQFDSNNDGTFDSSNTVTNTFGH